MATCFDHSMVTVSNTQLDVYLTSDLYGRLRSKPNHKINFQL